MTINLEHGNIALRLWFMIHRTHELLRTCEDKIFGEYKLTTEHYAVLATIRYLESTAGAGNVRPTDVARWLGRSTNSVSMIVDRMVKVGLLRRVRDRADRRVVFLIITDKGEEALKPATLSGWDFIQKILSPVSQEDRQTLIKLLETLQYEASRYLNPKVDIEQIRKIEAKSYDNLMQRLVQHIPLSALEAKRQGSRQRKTIQ